MITNFLTFAEGEKTAASGDILSGTELDTIPSSGVLFVRACSTVNTATIELPQIGHKPGVTNLLKLRANGIPDPRDVWVTIPVIQGTRPVIAVGGTTGTIHWEAGFVRK